MIDPVEVLQIIRADEAREIKDFVVASVVVAAVAIPMLWYVARRFGKHGAGFVAFALVMLIFASSFNEPIVEYDDYLTKNGKNAWTPTGAWIAWRKTNLQLPDSQPLYISTQPLDGSQEPTIAVTTTVGANSNHVFTAGATNVKFIVWHDWLPPVPVHTNGVWIGTILERAKGTVGNDKLLIINGQLLENGKVLAPITEGDNE